MSQPRCQAAALALYTVASGCVWRVNHKLRWICTFFVAPSTGDLQCVLSLTHSFNWGPPLCPFTHSLLQLGTSIVSFHSLTPSTGDLQCVLSLTHSFNWGPPVCPVTHSLLQLGTSSVSCHSLTPLEVQDAEGESGRAAGRVFWEGGRCGVGVEGRGTYQETCKLTRIQSNPWEEAGLCYPCNLWGAYKGSLVGTLFMPAYFCSPPMLNMVWASLHAWMVFKDLRMTYLRMEWRMVHLYGSVGTVICASMCYAMRGN